MKQVETFSTQVDNVRCVDCDFENVTSARVGWALEMERDEDRVVGFKVKLLSLSISIGDKDIQVNVSDYSIRVIPDHSLGFDSDLMPKEVVIYTTKEILINF